ncbi:metallophosphoesterase [Sphingobacterium sp. SGR-19]|uniref:metallophosphoesterase n=1 Tax=Sphingobacterium sp. SGR-19 TaxID=2710886 RepID=UPI0013EAF486|nr:metallophosphoesterase [Sphingobacterium sp. SGR-19]NGM64412.1 hypothetical protein [Sphingobacterium sp. SGR-19]
MKVTKLFTVLAVLGCIACSKAQIQEYLNGASKMAVTPKAAAEDFMIAVIGDTQYYTENQGTNGQYIEQLHDQINWIREHRVDSNIVAVISVGDIIDDYDHTDLATQQQWMRASEAYAELENIPGLPDGIPYGVVAGNHDIDFSAPWGVSPYYDTHFGQHRFSGRSYYQEGYPEGTNENHYDFINTSSVNLMVVYLRWNRDQQQVTEAIDWAYQQIAAHPDRQAIVVTHYTVSDNKDVDIDGKSDWGLQEKDGISQAEQMYTRFRELPNFFLMLGGHVSGEGRRVDVYNGNMVHAMTVDYQGREYVPGLLRTIKFSPSNDRLDCQTFVPGSAPIDNLQSTFSLPWKRSYTMSRTNDYNNDGRSEPAFFQDGNWIIPGQPNQTFGDRPTDIPVPADYDGDGKTEVAIFREGTTYNRWIRPDAEDDVFGQPGDIPTPGDFNGNGQVDYAFFRPSKRTWYVRYNYMPSPRYVTQVYGAADDIPVPADYDGDGKVDYALFRPSTAEWFRFAIHRGQYGKPGDIPVPGDYNGDGITERSIYRPSTNEWYVDGIADPVIIGQTGDIPTPGDYNGDGKTDRAVYRPQTGELLFPNGQTISTGVINGVPLNLPYAISHHFFGGN